MNNPSLLKSKLKAAALHSLFTGVVALISGWLVFGIWYPEPFATMLGGTELYKIILVVELVLGPLVSLIIYNPKKPRSELVRDYLLVGTIQFSALTYGLFIVSGARPVFLVFVKDRIEIVTAVELDPLDLKESKEFSSLSWSGAQNLCVENPVDSQEKSDLLWSAINEGKDIQLYPRYYRGCYEGEVFKKAYKKERLELIMESIFIEPLIRDGLPKTNYKWLPVKSRFGVWIQIFPESSQSYYLPINPYSS